MFTSPIFYTELPCKDKLVKIVAEIHTYFFFAISYLLKKKNLIFICQIVEYSKFCELSHNYFSGTIFWLLFQMQLNWSLYEIFDMIFDMNNMSLSREYKNSKVLNTYFANNLISKMIEDMYSELFFLLVLDNKNYICYPLLGYYRFCTLFFVTYCVYFKNFKNHYEFRQMHVFTEFFKLNRSIHCTGTYILS